MEESLPELSPMQQMFCREYLKDYNGTQAAIRAGYAKDSATQQGSRLLTYVQVIEEINRLQAKKNEKIEVTADMVLQELIKMGFSDIHNYVDNDYKIKNLEEIPEGATGAIKSVEIEEATTYFNGGEKTTKNVKFKLHDKLGALEKIAKHISFYAGEAKQKELVIKIIKDKPQKKEDDGS